MLFMILDFILLPGPFLQDPSCSRFADFTATIYMDYHSIIVPLKFSSQPLSFLYPLNPLVWTATAVSIPVFILAMGLLDMYYCRGFRIDWSSIVEFALRTAMNAKDAPLQHLSPHKMVLMFSWIFVFFIITQSYAGTLTAMITKPTLSRPINTIDEMLAQTETPWMLEKGSGLYFYMKNSAEGSDMRKLYDGAEGADWGQIVSSVMGGEYIVPTVGIATEEWTSQDFHKRGKCNFYKIGGKFLFASFSMALPVTRLQTYMKLSR